MILQNGKRIDGCSDTVPVGTLQPYLGLVPPKGYLVCQGQLVSKITYSKLYEICGDSFGTSTETHFYLPDLRGKTLAGYDENDSTMNTIGKLLGQKTHTHTSAAHTHTIAGHVHSTGNHTLTVAEMPSHTHNMETVTETSSGAYAGRYMTGKTSADPNLVNNPVQATGGSGAHNHGNTGSTALTSDSTTPGATGSNTNYQPTITVNWIVKAVMLIPDYIIVEDKLTSDSAVDALSARQGKILNEKFTDYATKSEMIQYVPLSGGTLTGAINMLNDQYYASAGSYALNLNNSDIIGLNSLYWQDVCNDDTEGIHFIRTNNNTDTLRGYEGDLIWTPNHSKTAAGTRYSILGTHNTKDYVVECGTSGNWMYRKWNSGAAECWGKFVHANALACSKQWGILWETDNIGTTDVPNYPVSFTDIPSSCVECQGTSMAYLSLERSGATKTHIGNIYLTRPDGVSTFSAGFTITVYAIGRWK